MGHSKHLSPSVVYFPAGQAVHVEDCMVEYFPCSHVKHSLLFSALRFPAAHTLQVPSPVSFLNVPGSQKMHELLVLFANPFLQVQFRMEVLFSDEVLFVGQKKHSASPDSLP